MTEEQFLSREAQLEAFEHASDGKLIHWVLVPRNDLQTLEFKCSCETYRRRALVAKPSTSPTEAIGYGIASVFCPPEYRRKGYASHMMRLLHHVLSPLDSLPPFPQEWGAPPPRYPGIGGDARFSVLYSDIGDFYRLCGPTPNLFGWHIHGPVSTTWKLKPGEANQTDAMDEGYDLLSEQQCNALWETDATYITNYVSQLPASHHTRFTFLPDNGVAAFQLHRVVAEAPLNPKHPLEHWGVKAISQEDDLSSTYATWTLDMRLSIPPVLVVTRLRASPKSFPSLLKVLVWVAGQLSADAVEIWNLDTKLVDVAASLGGNTVDRSEHLPAVAWYGPEHPSEIEWVFNEKFPWC
ncbi:hypothetical protein JB92DRAFT_2806886 [Gautieria morchelliformis]|nr:hypothetical protein JB92DRAFT_2806886 [Gautieria morchelliformis]